MTGPISFSVEEARQQILDTGIVHTARPADRTTGQTWANWTRGGKGKLNVRVSKLRDIDQIEDLVPFQATSGFRTADRWAEAIRETHGVDSLRDAGLAVYEVTLKGYREHYEGEKIPTGYLTFDHPNIGYIIDDLEDATIRVALEREFTPGQEIALQTPKGRVFGIATVEDVYQCRVEQAYFDAAQADNRNHPASSTQDLLERLRSHYPDREIHYDTEVTTIYIDCHTLGVESDLPNLPQVVEQQ